MMIEAGQHQDTGEPKQKIRTGEQGITKTIVQVNFPELKTFLK